MRPSAVGRLAGSAHRAVEEGRVDVAFVLDAPVDAPGLSVEPLLEEGVIVATRSTTGRSPVPRNDRVALVRHHLGK